MRDRCIPDSSKFHKPINEDSANEDALFVCGIFFMGMLKMGSYLWKKPRSTVHAFSVRGVSQPPPLRGTSFQRKEGECPFPASSFRAKARNLFRSRSGEAVREAGNGKHRASCDWGSRCFMQTDLRRKTANGKRKRSLGCARDDETRKRFLPTPFSIRSGSQPPALRATSFQRKEGEKVKNLSLLSLSGAVLYSYAAPCRCPFNAPQIFVFQRSPL